MKAWKDFDDECPYCGDSAEVFTEAPTGMAYDGDRARCVACGMPGTMLVEEEGAGSVQWHDSSDCQCQWCKTHPVTP